MKSKLLAVAALAVPISFATPSNAITYNVNLSVGPGSITGFIATNGDIGVLSTADITDWKLTIFDGVTSATIQPGTILVAGSSLTATPSGLFFDFSGGPGGFLGFPSAPFLCLEDASGACSAHPSTISIDVPGGAAAFWVNYIGNVEIGATPLPAALPLFATGLGALGLLGWRRKRKQAAELMCRRSALVAALSVSNGWGWRL